MKSKVVLKIDENYLLISFKHVHIYVCVNTYIYAHIFISPSVYVSVCFYTYTYLGKQDNALISSLLICL